MLLALNSAAGVGIFFRPRCKLWSCPVCGELNRYKWSYIARHGADTLLDQGEDLAFVTITHQGHLNAPATRQRWRECWPKLAEAARRTSGNFQYILVHEQHEDGRMHSHLVTTAVMGKRWWKDAGARRGFGYMNDSEPVYNADGASWYVSKYLGKSLSVENWPRHWRRVGTSRNWPRNVESAEGEGWEFRPLGRRQSVQEVEKQMIHTGWKTLHSDHAEAWRQIEAVNTATDQW